MVGYEEARRNEKKRQEYLNNLLCENPNKVVKKIAYHSRGMGTASAYIRMNCRSEIGIGKKLSISVNPSAFDIEEGHLKSLLLDHEYIHAGELFEGVEVRGRVYKGRELIRLPQGLCKKLVESHAYANQIAKGKGRDLTPLELFSLLAQFQGVMMESRFFQPELETLTEMERTFLEEIERKEKQMQEIVRKEMRLRT